MASSPSSINLKTLETTLDDMQKYLQSHQIKVPARNVDASGLHSTLLKLCRKKLEDIDARQEGEPVRTLHHFACTGGTLFSQCLAVMPNTIFLNEIDPLSQLEIRPSANVFAPTDTIMNLQLSPRKAEFDEIKMLFNISIDALRHKLSKKGQFLLIRDHTHSHFCAVPSPEDRPTLREIISSTMPVVSVVTVRHPLDSFLSLQNNGWVHFHPTTLDAYSARYLMFLDAYENAPRYRYEDLVKDPANVILNICQDLQLPFFSDFEALLYTWKISGDSGRKSFQISNRQRRPVPDDIRASALESEDYSRLCSRLGYDPNPDVSAMP